MTKTNIFKKYVIFIIKKNINMKQIIRLTENQLYNLIEKATKRIIESDESKKTRKKPLD